MSPERFIFLTSGGHVFVVKNTFCRQAAIRVMEKSKSIIRWSDIEFFRIFISTTKIRFAAVTSASVPLNIHTFEGFSGKDRLAKRSISEEYNFSLLFVLSTKSLCPVFKIAIPLIQDVFLSVGWLTCISLFRVAVISSWWLGVSSSLNDCESFSPGFIWSPAASMLAPGIISRDSSSFFTDSLYDENSFFVVSASDFLATVVRDNTTLDLKV